MLTVAHLKKQYGGMEILKDIDIKVEKGAIARAVAADPEIIYFDEPTSALDPELTGEVLEVMQNLAAEGRTMLVVTHEMGFARNVSTRTILMEKGSIVEEGETRQVFEAPKKERTKEFLGHFTGGTDENYFIKERICVYETSIF